MDDLIVEIDELIESSDYTSNALEKANKLITKAEDAIAFLEATIETLENPITAEETSDLLVEDVILQGKFLYDKEVKESVITNPEFAYLSFLEPLLEVGDNTDLYSIIVTGNGWSKRASVNLNMNEVAGDINDYAQAVLAARELAETNGRQNSPETASRLWARYYANKSRRGGGVYSDTIAARMQNMESLAPFWSLLNDGNKIAMASNWGGYPTPDMEGTHFVENVEKDMATLFRDGIRLARYDVEASMQEMSSTIKETKKRIADLYGLISRLENNFEEPEVYADAIGKSVDDINKSKLYRTLDKATKGEYLPKRIDIGLPGQPRVRISRAKALALVSSE